MVAAKGTKLFKALYLPYKCTPKQKQKVEPNLENQSRTEIEFWGFFYLFDVVIYLPFYEAKL